LKSQATPGLRKPGGRRPERGGVLWRTVACRGRSQGSDSPLVCSGDTALQKLAGGMWPSGPRRIAGKHLGLAPLGLGRERMSEAGPLAAKPGYQWRSTRWLLG
jgi:hypothetical protein